ncbi:hypothetical protein A3C25_05410 [Candidatus Roizmanbacteria bacterium RIFCSPHIGHO2_02_FULL_38_11]|uniref:Malonyl CoA-acyl carrier protein transacylase n=1 Tax=Candidatus Roizmanbacteria bacterium RIFCSPHIGHO2_02_FULL_38_11 TaxID=1802039 RepID=A0A1F7GYJ7_9BACT|nr:MAG: hypothetical protein A3C25_05410 [Candidatus Roizmanbacteria bacterium RIFCSPHIGHO2_02_FULL_38_11]
MPVEIFSGDEELARIANVAYVFPGQGSQIPMMALDLYENIPAAREVIEEAEGVIGRNLVSLMLCGQEEELSRTENAQPLILIASLANLVGYFDRYPPLRKRLPAVAFGHSLGELTALVIAGVLSYKDALKIAKLRGKIMACAPVGEMVAVRNISQEELEFILDKFQVDLGVINSDRQIVLSGDSQAMKRAVAYMESKKIKQRKLLISIASHSRVMQGAQQEFALALDAFTFHDARIPIISVFEAQKLKAGSEIKTAFIEQMTHPLDFPRMLSVARGLGADTFVEFGPKGLSQGGIVTGNIHELDSSLTAFNIRDLSTIRDNPLSF